LASAFCLVSSILFSSYFLHHGIYYIFPARIFAGLGFGLAYPAVLIHACEVAVPQLRAMIVGCIPFAVTFGVFSASSSLLPVHATRNYEVDPTRTIGINGVVIIVSGLIIAAFFNRESPVFLIKKHRDQEALDIMIRLRSESYETSEIRKDFEDMKLMVFEDSKSNVNIFDKKNRCQLYFIVLLKIIVVASFNMPLNLIFLEATETKFYNGENDPSGMILSGIKWIIMLIMTFFIDQDRKKFYKISCGLAGTALIFLSILPQYMEDKIDEWTKTVVAAIIVQISSGLAMGMLPDIYATEAFDTKKKPLALAFALAVEFSAQIGFVIMFYYFDVEPTHLIGGCGTFTVIGVIVSCFLPNTSGLSLREARNNFFR
jgi:hypothetical protein